MGRKEVFVGGKVLHMSRRSLSHSRSLDKFTCLGWFASLSSFIDHGDGAKNQLKQGLTWKFLQALLNHNNTGSGVVGPGPSSSLVLYISWHCTALKDWHRDEE